MKWIDKILLGLLYVAEYSGFNTDAASSYFFIVEISAQRFPFLLTPHGSWCGSSFILQAIETDGKNNLRLSWSASSCV